MTKKSPTFPQAGLKFLTNLKRNNNREWFLEHKPEYEESVRAPMTQIRVADPWHGIKTRPERKLVDSLRGSSKVRSRARCHNRPRGCRNWLHRWQECTWAGG